jgi:hypothetical protein
MCDWDRERADTEDVDDLRRVGAGKWVVIAMCVSIVFVVHTAPAAIGLAAFAIAGVLRERQRTRPETPGGRAALASP